MGWRKKHAYIATIVLLSLAVVPLANAVPPPLVIYGYAVYDGKGIPNVDVEATNKATGEKITEKTDENGFFTITLGNPPYTWNIGNKIVLRAIGLCVEGYTEFTVKSDKPIMKNISLNLLLKARFVYIPLTPRVGDEVSFTDLSTNAQSWHWDFGDGSASNERNPRHVYNKTGKYNVTLTVTCNGFTNSVTKEITVIEEKEEDERKTPGYLFISLLASLSLAMFIRKKCIRSR